MLLVPFFLSKFVCIVCIQSLKESWVAATESFLIELVEAILHKCSKIVFPKYWKNSQENTHTRIQLQMIGCNLANVLADIRSKKFAYENCAFDVLNFICMPFACLFCLLSSGMKLRVRRFRDIIDFGLHCSLSVSSILLYFISIKAWTENLHIKNCIKNLMVVMPSYFYKDNKYRTWISSVKKAILVTS